MSNNSEQREHPLEIFFKHNLWSNLQIFDFCINLDNTALDFAAAGALGSIRMTLGHIMFAEERYIFHITSGKEMAEAIRPTEETALGELRSRVEKSGQKLLELATTLDGSDLVRIEADSDSFEISKEALLLQAIHHAHEHRTQIESMFGEQGIEPPGLSGWRYYDELTC